MKIINIIGIQILCLVLFTECNFLDFDESTGKKLSDITTSYDGMNRFLSTVYTYLPSEFSAIGGSIRDAATDDAIYTWSKSDIYSMNNGSWSALKTFDTRWSNDFKGIFSANFFLENIKPEMLDDYKWEPKYDEYIEKLNVNMAEARFLRAFYHFDLAKRYGDIPLITKVITEEEANTVHKTSFEDVIKFIVDECDLIIPILPKTHQANTVDGFYGETGRITKGAAMALKARALLYAASPLHNPGNSEQKWEAAAKASWDIINSGYYSLETITNDPLYTKEGNDCLKSKQLILERRGTDSNSFEKGNLPFGFEGATGGATPTQNLAEVYEMKDGTKFNFETHKDKMFYDGNGAPTRDPRFYKNILPNEGTFGTTVIETFYGGKNAQPLLGATLTGYYLRKYLFTGVSLKAGSEKKLPHHYVLFRYAEVLLNYAEAMNELVGPDGTRGECQKTAREAIEEVRTAATMGAVITTDFTQYIKDERRRELAFEDHRFWDVRRWKIGNAVMKEIYGLKIEKDDSGNYQYSKVKIEDRYWNDKMNLYPIPQSEIYINKNLLDQNPGW